jgi:hypothetical protein
LNIDFITEIELAIAAVFVLHDIAWIDANTNQKLVNICLKDERCTKRCYNHMYLQNHYRKLANGDFKKR